MESEYRTLNQLISKLQHHKERFDICGVSGDDVVVSIDYPEHGTWDKIEQIDILNNETYKEEHDEYEDSIPKHFLIIKRSLS